MGSQCLDEIGINWETIARTTSGIKRIQNNKWEPMLRKLLCCHLNQIPKSINTGEVKVCTKLYVKRSGVIASPRKCCANLSGSTKEIKNVIDLWRGVQQVCHPTDHLGHVVLCNEPPVQACICECRCWMAMPKYVQVKDPCISIMID